MYDYLPRGLEFLVIMLARRVNRNDIQIKYDGQIAWVGNRNDFKRNPIRKDFIGLKLASTNIGAFITTN